MVKRIALFGTSADPPTIAHKKILEELSKIYAFTIGYVSNNPNKNHKEGISIRSHLLKTLIEDLDNPKILFNQKVSSEWAVESIKKCKAIYKFNDLDFVIGSDLIFEIFYWKMRVYWNQDISLKLYCKFYVFTSVLFHFDICHKLRCW